MMHLRDGSRTGPTLSVKGCMNPRRAAGCTTLLLAIATAMLLLATGVARAAPVVRVKSVLPDAVTAGAPVIVFVTVENTGADPLTGDLQMNYTLPPGVVPADPIPFSSDPEPACQTTGQEVRCVADVTGLAHGGEFTWKTATTIEPLATGTLTGQIEISGGGAPQRSMIPISFKVGSGDPFSVKSFLLSMTDAPSFPAQQAGSDPAELETDVSFPSEAKANLGLAPGAVNAPAESFKDVIVHVPPGFIGNPTATPRRCTAPQLVTPIKETSTPTCPLESQIGVVEVNGRDREALWNMVPAKGAPAQFGFYYLTLGVTLTAKVRPSDYGVDIVSRNTSSSIPVPKFSVIMWGVPGDRSHDPQRGLCLSTGGTGCTVQTERVPFLRTPTSCPGTPLTWGIEVNTYQHPDVQHAASTTTPTIEDCQLNPFEPSLSLTPSALTPHAPSGVDATLSMPQDYGPDGLAPADLRTATVTLAPGMTIDPSSADGLAACSDAQLGLGQEGVATCPDASKLGALELRTPLLDHPIGGAIFLRTQSSSDPLSGEEYRIAIELRSDDDGIDIKLPGQIEADPVTGRLTTVFDDLPQLPFESMTLHFKTGPRAPLVTPSACGAYSTHSQLTSWSQKTVSSDSPFTISADGNGGPCAAPTFTPSLTAGTENPVAGAFSPFALQLQRSDADRELAALNELSLPPGLLANAASVAVRCTDAQAAAAACPTASHLGSVTVGAGAGSNPFYVSGDVYLMGQQTSGPFKGDPFGLAVVVHALAGPFDLGYVVVRAGIQIHDDGSVSTQSEPFPSILQGIPLQLRDIRVSLDRPGFIFNPTSCSPKTISGSVSSLQGQSASLSSRFQVDDCAALAFKPDFKASTAAKTSKLNGAALRVHLGTHEGPRTTPKEANIAKVEVQLPAVLPSRLATLQKACTAAQFEEDPARCPEGSFVGTAIAHTPILASPLSGPAILVSHGGAAFPDLVLVLQGEGVRIDLTGHTQIKNGVTLSHFETVPDAPVSSFDLNLPAGPHSVLAANANLCVQNPTMPTKLTAQNGAVLNQNTRIEVEGCSNALSLVSKKLHGKTLTLRVGVPAAGQLSASGKSLSKSTKSSSGRETVTVKLRVSRNSKFATKVTLVFSPKSGRGLSRSGRRLSKSIKVKT